MKTIKDLVAALFNATVVLLIALTICLVLLVGRVTELRDGTADLLAPQVARLERIAAAVERFEAQGVCHPGTSGEIAALRAELAMLRRQIPDLAGLETVTAPSLARAIIDELAARLTGTARS